MKVNIPKTAHDYNDLGVYLTNLGKYDEAILMFKKALEINTTIAEVHTNLGNTLAATDQPNKAIKELKIALNLNPNSFNALHSLGSIFFVKNNTTLALRYFNKATKVGKSEKLYYNLAACYRKRNDAKKAIKYLKLTLVENPTNIKALNNLAIAIPDQKEARKLLKKAIKTNVNPVSLHNLALNYYNNNEKQLAISTLENSLKIFPDHGQSLGSLYYWYTEQLNWGKMAKLVKKLDATLVKSLKKTGTPAEEPQMNLIRNENPRQNQKVAVAWSTQIEKRVRGIEKNILVSKRKRGKGLILGYLSDGFGNFPTGHKISELFANHDRNKFTVNVYSYGKDDGSIYKEKIEDNVDNIRYLHGKNFIKIAEVITKDEVDILIDLKGHTKGSMLEVSAMRPAPIQICWLGFPGTTGANFFDYAIVDKVVVGKKDDKYWSEKLLFMPHTYQVTDDKQPISDANYTLSDFDLPKNTFIFSNFNLPYKINYNTFLAWVEILKNVPNSVFWQLSPDNKISFTLKKHFRDKGIDKSRIIIAKELPKQDHLARMALSDLALDTFTVNGHTTTMDALWVGLPVLTKKGNHFASRVSASLLKSIGLSSLIVNTKKEYINQAIFLAQNPKALDKLKRQLIKNIETKPLFNTSQFTKNFEQLLIKAWENQF